MKKSVRRKQVEEVKGTRDLFEKLREKLEEATKGMTNIEIQFHMDCVIDFITKHKGFKKMTDEQIHEEAKIIKREKAKLPKYINVIGLNNGTTIHITNTKSN